MEETRDPPNVGVWDEPNNHSSHARPVVAPWEFCEGGGVIFQSFDSVIESMRVGLSITNRTGRAGTALMDWSNYGSFYRTVVEIPHLKKKVLHQYLVRKRGTCTKVSTLVLPWKGTALPYFPSVPGTWYQVQVQPFRNRTVVPVS